MREDDSFSMIVLVMGVLDYVQSVLEENAIVSCHPAYDPKCDELNAEEYTEPG